MAPETERLLPPGFFAQILIFELSPEQLPPEWAKPNRLVPKRRSDDGSGVVVASVVELNAESGPPAHGVEIFGARNTNPTTSFASSFFPLNVAGFTVHVFTAAIAAGVSDATG